MAASTISIALCTYNGERFLREQLDSLASQTRLPHEVIVGDDGSTDSTLLLLEQWAKEVPFPVHITRNEKKLGFAKNFEATMLRCTGDVIFPCDQDDVWLPEKLEKMTGVLEDNPQIGVVYCGSNLIDSEGLIIPNYLWSHLAEQFPFDASVYWPKLVKKIPTAAGCISAVRHSVLTFLLPLPSGWPHDMWIYVSSPIFTELHMMDTILVQYRRHENNVSDVGDIHNSPKTYAYYRESLAVFAAQKKLREELHSRWKFYPDNLYKKQYLEYLDQQKKHFERREQIEKSIFLKMPLLFYEILNGSYFRHRQSVKSILFDIKEGFCTAFYRK